MECMYTACEKDMNFGAQVQKVTVQIQVLKCPAPKVTVLRSGTFEM